jgi:hypothetical protein
MPTEPLFTIADDVELVTFTFEKMPLSAPAALLSCGVNDFRESIVGKVSRAPYCMMGVCFECFVEIDGVPARQSCLIPVCAGMAVRRQVGAAGLAFGDGDEA